MVHVLVWLHGWIWFRHCDKFVVHESIAYDYADESFLMILDQLVLIVGPVLHSLKCVNTWYRRDRLVLLQTHNRIKLLLSRGLYHHK